MTRFKDDFYHRFLYKHMDMILPVTFQVAEQIKKFIPEAIRPKIEVLYMGSDDPEILSGDEIRDYKKEIGVKEDEFLIGMIGRIEEAKGQYLLIEAAQKLKRDGVRIKVCFVGHAMQESYQRELEKRVSDKGLDEEISILGFTKNPHKFMQASDSVVLATPCETFGLVLIEAMQVGTAVVATDQCGPLEIIEYKKTGLLFKQDSSEDLAAQLDTLIRNREYCLSLSQAGRRKAQESFSNKRQFEKLRVALELSLIHI